MKSLRLLIAIAVAVVTAGSNVIAGEQLKIDPAKSKITFKVRHLLGSAKGKFTKFGGTLNIDRQHPEESSVTATIQVGSIDTGIVKRDEHLRSEEFFNVQKFPEMTFHSRKVKKTAADAGEILGDLTMHGVTRPITLQVSLISSSESILKDRSLRWRITAGPIKRSEFGLVWSKSVESVSMIGDEVSIEMEIETAKTAL
jgi:polyisoprenoid-binding protein YceI